MSKINILDQALAHQSGSPVEAELFGIDFTIRRDFTGEEAANYLALFIIPEDEDENGKPVPQTVPIKDQIEKQLLALTTLKKGSKGFNQIVDRLLEMPVLAISKILVTIGVTAGLRAEDTSFLLGQASSSTMQNSDAS